jgi:uncharacterized protein
MKRREKEIRSREEIDAVIERSPVCRLAMAVEDEPYVVPLSFGYDGEHVYFHSAGEGRKIDFIERNDRVCFEFESEVEVVEHAENACQWTFFFESVIGYGRVAELVSPEEKERGLGIIMRHYSDRAWSIRAKGLRRTRVWCIAIESLTGKRNRREDP